MSFAVLLTRAGDIELPPVELGWWDLNADRARVVRLPGRVIRVAASGDPALDGVGASGREFSPEFASAPPDAWQKALLIALIVALFLLWTGFGDRLQQLLHTAWRRHQALRRLQRACSDDDAQAARIAVLCWAREQWPDRATFGLGQIRQRLPAPELAAALTALDAAIYAAGGENWQGRGLWRALRLALRSRSVERGGQPAGKAGLYSQLAQIPD